MNEPRHFSLLSSFVVAATLFLQAAALISGRAQEVSESAPIVFRYTPAIENAAPARVAGVASRGPAADTAPSLTLLTPDHIAGTLLSHPVLAFHQSKKAEGEIEIVVTAPFAEEPVFRKVLAADAEAGIRLVETEGSGPGLEPGIEYQWSASYVVDRRNRSADVYASGYVMRLENPETEKALSEMGGGDRLDKAARLAVDGVWYDAIAMLIALREREGDEENEALAAEAASALASLLKSGELSAETLLAESSEG